MAATVAGGRAKSRRLASALAVVANRKGHTIIGGRGAVTLAGATCWGGSGRGQQRGFI